MVWLPIGGTVVLDLPTSVLLTVLFVVLTINALNCRRVSMALPQGSSGHRRDRVFVYAFLLSVEFDSTEATGRPDLRLAGEGSVWASCRTTDPAKLFHGDTGSMLIGLLLSASAIMLSRRVDPSAVRGELLPPAILPPVAAAGRHRGSSADVGMSGR